MILRPDTGWAYGLPPAVSRSHRSHQPSRRSCHCSGITACPYVQTSNRTNDGSLIPRAASTASTPGCRCRASSTSWNSSTVKLGVTPGTWVQDTTRSATRSTTASYAWFVGRSQQHGKGPARHRVTGSPGQHLGLGRLQQLDRGKPPGLPHGQVSAQDRRGGPKLGGRQRFERVHDRFGGHGLTLARSSRAGGSADPRPRFAESSSRPASVPGAGDRATTSPRGGPGNAHVLSLP